MTGSENSRTTWKKKVLFFLDQQSKLRLHGLSLGEAGFNRLLYSYKKSAEERGLEFILLDEEFKDMVLRDCYYCGTGPQNVKKRASEYSKFKYNGIDRIDNSRGYFKENCVPCCKKCNRMKYIYDINEFIRHCILIDTFQKSMREEHGKIY